MKSWQPSLISFNPFVIVFYFLFRRLAKRAAPVDYYYDVYMEPPRAYIKHAKAYANPLRLVDKMFDDKKDSFWVFRA